MMSSILQIMIEPLLKYLKPNSYVWCPFDLAESNFKLLFKWT